MDSSTQTSADDAKSMNDLFELVEKQRIQLNVKDKELQENRQANEELLANMELEKVRAKNADELETKLANAHKTINAFQMALWKAFPSPHLCYHIKTKASSGNGEYGYLYVDNSGYLCLSVVGDHHPKGHFKFEKDSDGTVSIYSKSTVIQTNVNFCLQNISLFTAKYLQVQTSCFTSAASVMFCANVENKSKFTLNFHPQQEKQLPSILVDIFSLANRCFLSAEVHPRNRLVGYSLVIGQQTRVEANSLAAPAEKFFILAEDLE